MNFKNCKRLREFKFKSQGKAAEVTVNSKEENSGDFCLDFFQVFGLCFLHSLVHIMQVRNWQVNITVQGKTEKVPLREAVLI